MKYSKSLIFLALTASFNVLGDESNSKYGFFEGDELSKGQCGCWYHYPRDKGIQGKVLGLGEAAQNSIYFKIHGAKVQVDNWGYSDKDNFLITEYSNESYQVKVHSEMIEDNRFSSTYNSTITIKSGSETDVIKVFGSCGC
jgi:hypothetical protein